MNVCLCGTWMCRSMLVPLVCPCDYSQTWIHTEAHRDFYFCSYLGSVFSHSVLAFGRPMVCPFPNSSGKCAGTSKAGGNVILFFFSFFLFFFYFLSNSPSDLKLQLYSTERGNTKALYLLRCGYACVCNKLGSYPQLCFEEFQQTSLGPNKLL